MAGLLPDQKDPRFSTLESALSSVRGSGDLLEIAPDVWKDNTDVVSAAIENAPHVFEHASERVRALYPISLRAVELRGANLAHLPKQLRSDRTCVLAAVSNNGNALFHASDELRGDKEIVLAAVKNSGYALILASTSLREDPEFIRNAIIASGGKCLPNVGGNIGSNRDFILSAVSTYRLPFDYVPVPLRGDMETMITAIEHQNNTFHSLELVHEELRGDRNFIHKCITEANIPDVFSWSHFPEELKQDRDLVIEGVRKDVNALLFTLMYFQDDHELFEIAVSKDGQFLQHLPDWARADKGIVLAALENNGLALQYASEELRADIEIIHAAMLENAWSICHARISSSDPSPEIDDCPAP